MRDYDTGQRRCLIGVLEKHCDRQLSAEQIAGLIEAEGGEISLSAVYRNIERLEQEGLVRRSLVGGSKKAVYQYIGGQCAMHLHLQCVSCGQISHLDDEAANAMREAVSACGDFAIDEKMTVLYGRCKECVK